MTVWERSVSDRISSCPHLPAGSLPSPRAPSALARRPPLVRGPNHDATATAAAPEQGRPSGRWLDLPRRRILVSNRRRCRQEGEAWRARDGGFSRRPGAGAVRLGHARAAPRARRDGGVQEQRGRAAAGLPRHLGAWADDEDRADYTDTNKHAYKVACAKAAAAVGRDKFSPKVLEFLSLLQ